MRRKSKAGIICVCICLFFSFWLLNVRINTDGVLLRYFFPHDSFLIVNGNETIELSLDTVLDGKRRTIRAFTPQGGSEEYYFFLPVGDGQGKIRVINNLDSQRWKCSVEDFVCVNTIFEDGKKNVEFQVNDILHKKEKKICVCFMEADYQPSVFVEIGEELNDLTQDRNLKVKGKICIYDEEARLLFDDIVKIKGHGSGSWVNCDKKTWLFDFDEPTSILNMKEGYKYIAISNDRDPSYLRNKFIYDLAEKVGMAYSPHCEFANLYINGEYLGLYLFAEGIEASPGRVAVQEDRHQQARLGNPNLQHYKREDERGYVLPENEKQAENVGYLLREEMYDEEYDPVECGFITQNDSNFEIIYPKKATELQVANIKSYLQEFEDAVADQNGDYQKFIDEDSFIKKYLIEQISKNRDGNRRSSYYYIKSLGTDSTIYAGPVWDYDIAFGNINVSSWMEPKGIEKLNPGIDRHKEFMDKVIQYYIVYFKPFLETEAEQRIKEYQEEIRSSVYMDQVRWEKQDMGFDNAVNSMFSFLQIRKQFLDDVWLNGKTFYRINFVDGDTIVKTTYLEAGSKLGEIEFLNGNISGSGKEFIGWYDENLESEMDFNKEIADDLAFWAKWEE